MHEMPTAAPVPLSPEGSLPHPVFITAVRGLTAVLEFQPMLTSFAARCGQLGVVDYLEYFLTGPYVGPKTPCLFLVHSDPGARSPSAVKPEHLLGAVLLYEYRVRGLDTRVYVTDDDGGERTVLAPAEVRLRLAAEVAQSLIQKGARMVLLSVRSEETPDFIVKQAPSARRGKPLMWASRERTMRRTLALQSTFDETLAPMGKHTRRNLRAARRRAEADLDAVFVPAAQISLEEFMALNRLCSYPVPDRVSVWRYETAAKIPGGFIAGVLSRNGNWLCLLGGRRHHRVTEIGWQMNREDLEAYSPSNVMRSFLLDHEISLGTGKIYFEGGTAHSMQNAFTSDRVMDLLVSSRSLSAALLRRYAPALLPPKNLLAEILTDQHLKWRFTGQDTDRELDTPGLAGWPPRQQTSGSIARASLQSVG